MISWSNITSVLIRWRKYHVKTETNKCIAVIQKKKEGEDPNQQSEMIKRVWQQISQNKNSHQKFLHTALCQQIRKSKTNGRFLYSSNLPKFTHENVENLNTSITKKDIESNSTFIIRKSPGLDGLTAEFH